MKQKPFFYGGQAVIEGVMMRGRHTLAIAVRKQDGSLAMREDPIVSITQRFPILKYPPLRGVVALFEAMVIGIRALNYSAQEFAEEEEEELTTKETVFTIAFAFLMAIALFVGLPALLIHFIERFVSHHVVLNLIEGIIKITFFLLYIWGISFMDDIKRVFQYHGAEHKAINCYEAGQELTVDNVREASRFHKRCGTSFIVFVLLTSILVFSFFGKPPFLLRMLYHIALLPVVAGVSYEIIRLAGKESASKIMHWLSLPGIWTQHLTTDEPDDSQIEVAIYALEKVIESDKELIQKVTPLDARERRGVDRIAK